MNIVSIVFGQIVMMFCMMAVGAAAYKAGLITERGSTDLSNITPLLSHSICGAHFFSD